MAIGFKPIDEELGWLEADQPRGDIVQISYGWRTAWVLVAQYEHEGGDRWIIIDSPVSHRVHDERELLSYGEQIVAEGARSSFAYEITESAYLTEMRNGVSGLSKRKLRHVLLCGRNICLEVIVSDLPSWSLTPPEPIESVAAWEKIRADRLSAFINS